jgi:hypothetical protein
VNAVNGLFNGINYIVPKSSERKLIQDRKSKAKELAEQMFPEPQMENYDDILEYRNDRDWTFIARGAVVKGYEQAQQDYIEYAQLWVDSGEVNIKSFKQFLKDRGYE